MIGLMGFSETKDDSDEDSGEETNDTEKAHVGKENQSEDIIETPPGAATLEKSSDENNKPDEDNMGNEGGEEYRKKEHSFPHPLHSI